MRVMQAGEEFGMKGIGTPPSHRFAHTSVKGWAGGARVSIQTWHFGENVLQRVLLRELGAPEAFLGHEAS